MSKTDKKCLKGILKLSKLLNDFHFSVSYKTLFDTALMKSSVLLDLLWHNKGAKSTQNRSKIKQSKSDFFRGSLEA